MSSFELERQEGEGDGLVLVALTGELDLTNARALELRLREAAPKEARLVVDLNGVSFLDSAALHVLFGQARSRGRGGLAFLVEPGALVARTLEIAGLPQAAPTGASLEALPPASPTG